MNNIFVNYEIAQKLKSLSFNEKTLGYYHLDNISKDIDLFATGSLKLYSNSQ